MEMLTLTGAIFLFIATTAILCLLTHAKFQAQQMQNRAKESIDSANSALEQCKKLIASIQETHNSLTKQTASNAQGLQDIKFYLDATKKK